MRLQDKVALITGAGSNIGRAMARLFAREGAAVVVGDTDEVGGGETVRLIEAAGGRACSVAGDVSTTQGLRQSIDGAVETYGRLDMFLSNANSGASGTIAQFDRAGAEKLLMVNLMALMEGAHYCLPHMQQVGGGAIVATSSVQALVGVPGHPAYGAAKAGILGAVRSMAVELWPYKVRVNAVCPGGTGGKTWTVIDELGEEYLPEFEARFGREMRHLPLPVPTDPMAIAQCRAVFGLGRSQLYHRPASIGRRGLGHVALRVSSTDRSRSTRRRPEASGTANCKPNSRRG